MKKWFWILIFAVLLFAACQKAEKADDLAALMGSGPANAPVGPAADLKQLQDCCDENARAMAAECCLELDRLMQPQGAQSGSEEKPAMPEGMMGGPGFKSGRPIQVDEAVAKRWSRVKLSVGPKGGAGKELVLPVGGKTKIEGSSVEIEVVSFLPAFKMTSEAIISEGGEPNNPAAKVVIRETGKPDWTGWLFAKMPDVHAWKHDTLAVTLLGGVESGAK
ncbi:MAG: hypothetical protein GX444_01900 [Myxococcales bacterium]|nr:hypothetical protein [Myxococcales bacterium]